MRLTAGDVLSASFETETTIGERPKGLYFNGSKLKWIGAEAQDPEKRARVWKASVRYAYLKEGETCLIDWM